jgi:hypothetical protein
MIGSPKPTSYESLIRLYVNPLISTQQIPSTRPRDNGTIICGTGGGNTAKNYYKISLYAHDKSDVGKYRKTLLHGENERERK